MTRHQAHQITADYLTPLLRDFLGDARVRVSEIRLSRLRRGTSGSEMYKVAVRTAGRSEPIRLVLKVDKPGELNEARFFRDLAQRVPIGTPRVLDARILPGDRGWILMEELDGAKPGLSWTQEDARAVVRDMATLHAANWGDAGLATDFAWLPRPDANAIAEQIATMRSCVSAIGAAGLTQVLPDVLPTRRLRLIDGVLDRADEVLGPLMAAGTTLVHGDYWFHNVQLLPDGRRVLLDWQTCQIFSGVWELVYFIDLWHVIGKRSFRARIPETEEQVAAWYIDALRERDVQIQDDVFREALACARIWQPLTHWLTRYGRIAAGASDVSAWSIARNVPGLARAVATALASKGALRHMAHTWDRWERNAERFVPHHPASQNTTDADQQPHL